MSSRILDEIKKFGRIKKITPDIRKQYEKRVVLREKQCMRDAARIYRKVKKDIIGYIESLKTDDEFFQALCVLKLIPIDSSVFDKLRRLVKPDSKYANFALYRFMPFIEAFSVKFNELREVRGFPSSYLYFLLLGYSDRFYTPMEYLNAYKRTSKEVKYQVLGEILIDIVIGKFGNISLTDDELIELFNEFFSEYKSAKSIAPWLAKYSKNLSCSDASKFSQEVLDSLVEYIKEQEYPKLKDEVVFTAKQLINVGGESLYDCIVNAIPTGNLSHLDYFSVDDMDIRWVPDFIDNYFGGNAEAVLTIDHPFIKEFISKLSNTESVIEMLFAEPNADQDDVFRFLLTISKISPETVNADVLHAAVDNIAAFDSDTYLKEFIELLFNSKDGANYTIGYVLDSVARGIFDYNNIYDEPLSDFVYYVSEHLDKGEWVLKALEDLSEWVWGNLDTENDSEYLAAVKLFRQVEANLPPEKAPESVKKIARENTFVFRGFPMDLPAMYTFFSYPWWSEVVRSVEPKIELALEVAKKYFGDNEWYKLISERIDLVKDVVGFTDSDFLSNAEDTKVEFENMQSLIDVVTDEEGLVKGYFMPAILATGQGKPTALSHEHPSFNAVKAVAIDIVKEIFSKIIQDKCLGTSIKFTRLKQRSPFKFELLTNINGKTKDVKVESTDFTERDVITAAAPALSKLTGLDKKKIISEFAEDTQIDGYKTVGKPLIEFLVRKLILSFPKFSVWTIEKPYKKMTETERWAADVLSDVMGFSDRTVKDMNTFMKVLKSSYTGSLKRLVQVLSYDGELKVVVTANPYDVANMSMSPFVSSCQRLVNMYNRLTCLDDLSNKAFKAAFFPSFDFVLFAEYNNTIMARVSATISVVDGKVKLYFGENGNIYGDSNQIPEHEIEEDWVPPKYREDGRYFSGLSQTVGLARESLHCLIDLVNKFGLKVDSQPPVSLLYG